MHATRVPLQGKSNQNKFGISRALRFIRRRMKTKLYLATVIAVFSFLLSSRAAQPTPVASSETAVNAPEFKNLSDLKWEKILPDLRIHSRCPASVRTSIVGVARRCVAGLSRNPARRA